MLEVVNMSIMYGETQSLERRKPLEGKVHFRGGF
jgi:hypothetical protein